LDFISMNRGNAIGTGFGDLPAAIVGREADPSKAVPTSGEQVSHGSIGNITILY
jgi:hypothetical protein